jgi:outer membrane protein assembly factor BamD
MQRVQHHSDYKSAIVALENFVVDYPGTPYKEDALYYKLDSAIISN